MICGTADEITGAICQREIDHEEATPHKDDRDPCFEVLWRGNGKIPRLVIS